jgi:hypothetical protein
VRWIDKVLELALERAPTPLADVDPIVDAVSAAASLSATVSPSAESIKH